MGSAEARRRGGDGGGNDRAPCWPLRRYWAALDLFPVRRRGNGDGRQRPCHVDGQTARETTRSRATPFRLPSGGTSQCRDARRLSAGGGGAVLGQSAAARRHGGTRRVGNPYAVRRVGRGGDLRLL